MIAISNAPITPGPWDVSTNKVQDVYNIRGYHGRLVANAYLGANARLIAAAPDLLAALEECADYIASAHTNHNPFVIDARAAIAKAKGL